MTCFSTFWDSLKIVNGSPSRNGGEQVCKIPHKEKDKQHRDYTFAGWLLLDKYDHASLKKKYYVGFMLKIIVISLF